MSKFVKVQTQLRERLLVQSALRDLKLVWKEDVTYRHPFSGTTSQVVFLVTGPAETFGLREGPEGVLEAVGDDMQKAAIHKTLDRVQQRYAYHMVLREAGKAGFELVEETAGRDQVIRLTVRRWS